MSDLRILVVDDSAYNRRTIAELLSAIPGVEVVGKASDGDEALRLVASLEPDLITLDLEMPRMDGFTFLRLLMARRPTPVIVISGQSAKESVFRALELGALDFVAKPTRSVTSDLSGIQQDLAAKVELVRHLSPAGFDPKRRAISKPVASPALVSPQAASEGARERDATARFSTTEAREAEVRERERDNTGRIGATQVKEAKEMKERDREPPPPRFSTAEARVPRKIIVVAASTGGPTALLEVFSKLTSDAPVSVVVAQHMPEKFTRTFAERLDRLGGMRVFEATDTHALEPGLAYVCPGGRCIEVEKHGNAYVVRVVTPDAEDRYVPSADRLFNSAAAAAGDKTIAVVLTGMGDDGARGCSAIKREGGAVFAEAPETAVIYGMPGAAVRTGYVDYCLPLRPLAERLYELAK